MSSRPEGHSVDLAPGEPAPPATGELFAGHEVAAFESFLDNLATDNEYLFHPKVPASLSWNGFHTTKNQGFEEFKHSGLQFGSDKHFSPTNGYIARHKYVPSGYGHVHPQSSAQRSQRSSNSSRTHSRRPSLYTDQAGESPLTYGTSPSTSTIQQTHDHPVDRDETMFSPRAQSEYKRIKHDYDAKLNNREGSASQTSPRMDKPQTSDRMFRVPADIDTANTEARISSRTQDISAASAFGSRATVSSELETTVDKKIKLEDGASPKQPLTAAQKRQNHISSEQRRRNLIKEGFNELSTIVPSIVGNASKSTILHESIQHIKENHKRCQALRDRIEQLRSRRGQTLSV